VVRLGFTSKGAPGIRRIAPFLKDPSKKCRAEKILRSFENVATIKGNQTAAEFFQRMPASDQTERAEKDIRRLGWPVNFSEVGKPGASKEVGIISRRAHNELCSGNGA